MALTAFLFFLIVFTGVGLWASSKHRNNTEDYLLANRNVNPLLAGLSTMASLMSGFMFIGYIGLVYKLGLYAIWFFIGELTGLFLFTPWLQTRIQKISRRENIQTYTDFLGQDKNRRFNKLTMLVALFTLFFLAIYAVAQITAGGKALNGLFGWPSESGAVIGALILFLYSYKGGIRASIWTDAVQALVMLIAMLGLCAAGLIHVGGVQALYLQLETIDPNLVSLMPNGFLAAGLFLFGWLFTGLAVYSMPHIAIRFMIVPDEESAKKAQAIFLISVIIIALLATVMALLARVLILNLGDPELALPEMASLVLPEIFVGIVLAGIFASSMSSADSMVLSCSAALSQTIIPGWSRRYSRVKFATLLIIICVLLISIWSPAGVFDLVVFSVSGMGSVFGPLLVLKVLNRQPEEGLAIAMMFAGLISALLWRYGFGLNAYIVEAAPGILAGFTVYGLAKLVQAKRTANNRANRILSSGE